MSSSLNLPFRIVEHGFTRAVENQGQFLIPVLLPNAANLAVPNTFFPVVPSEERRFAGQAAVPAYPIVESQLSHEVGPAESQATSRPSMQSSERPGGNSRQETSASGQRNQ